MDCDAVQSRLSEHLDGELPPPDAAAVASHLAACRACRDAREGIARVARALSELPRTPAPPDLSRRVRETLARERLLAPEGTPPRARRIAWLKGAGLAAAAALALVLSVDSFVPRKRTPPALPPNDRPPPEEKDEAQRENRQSRDTVHPEPPAGRDATGFSEGAKAGATSAGTAFSQAAASPATFADDEGQGRAEGARADGEKPPAREGLEEAAFEGGGGGDDRKALSSRARLPAGDIAQSGFAAETPSSEPVVLRYAVSRETPRDQIAAKLLALADRVGGVLTSAPEGPPPPEMSGAARGAGPESDATSWTIVARLTPEQYAALAADLANLGAVPRADGAPRSRQKEEGDRPVKTRADGRGESLPKSKETAQTRAYRIVVTLAPAGE